MGRRFALRAKLYHRWSGGDADVLRLVELGSIGLHEKSGKTRKAPGEPVVKEGRSPENISGRIRTEGTMKKKAREVTGRNEASETLEPLF